MAETKDYIAPQDVGGTRKNLDKTVTQNELYSIVNIQTELSVGKQATAPDSLPEGVSQERAAAYFAGALQMLAAAQTKERLWWDAIKKKYELPADKNVYVDFTDGALYYYVQPKKA